MFSPINRRQALHRVGLLLGGAVSASTVSALLGGCTVRKAGDEAYAFATLDADQQALVGRLVDLVLPETDTPGARAAGAHEFIDKLLTDWMPEADKARFLAGLADVEQRAQQTHSRAFLDLSDADQNALLARLDAEAYAPQPTPPPGEAEDEAVERAQSGTNAMEESEERETGTPDEAGSGERGGDPNARPPAPPRVEGPPFFRTLKELTLAGYYTSEIGATQELQWQAAPGEYRADVPLSEVGRAWA